MAKVSGFGHSRPEVLDALRALGLDPNMIRRFSVEMGDNWIPTLRVEVVADPRIIDLALAVAGHPDLLIETVTEEIDLLGLIRANRAATDAGEAARTRRSALICEAMNAKIPRSQIASAAGVTEARLFQIWERSRASA